MRLALAVFLLSSGAFLGASLDHALLKLQVGKEIVRLFVFVPRHPEHRWLVVDAAVTDATETQVWSTSSVRQLDGDRAPVTHSYEFHLPKRSPFDEGAGRILSVRTTVECERAEKRAYVP